MAEHMTAAERGMRHLKAAGYKHVAHKNIHADAKTKLRAGGKVKGEASKPRMDRRARGGRLSMDYPDDNQGNTDARSARAEGGHVPKKGGGKTIINIIAGGGEKPPMMMPPGAGAPPPRPPVAGPPPGAMPPGAGMPPAPPPRPMMPPPGAGGPPPGMPPGGMPPRARGGRMC